MVEMFLRFFDHRRGYNSPRIYLIIYFAFLFLEAFFGNFFHIQLDRPAFRCIVTRIAMIYHQLNSIHSAGNLPVKLLNAVMICFVPAKGIRSLYAHWLIKVLLRRIFLVHGKENEQPPQQQLDNNVRSHRDRIWPQAVFYHHLRL